MFLSYIVRDPFGKVCAIGRGTRAECIENAFRDADEHAIDHFSILEDRRKKPAPLTALGALCCGRHGLTQTLAFGQRRLMCSNDG